MAKSLVCGTVVLLCVVAIVGTATDRIGAAEAKIRPELIAQMDKQYEVAYEAFRQGDLEKAERICREIIRQMPSHRDAAELLRRIGQPRKQEKIRVLIATGGHDFDREGFFAMWDAFPAIAYREVEQRKGWEAMTPANLEACDVLVLYDMLQGITDAQKAAFEAFLKRGGGLVALHHCIASHQEWPDYERIIGAKYFLKPEVRDGKTLPKSTYKHGVVLPVHIADRKHPITRGMSDFEIHDETYGLFLVDPKVHVLLTADHPDSGKNICWTRREGKARVVYLQLGHDNNAYANPNYRKIVVRAVAWAAGRLGP